MKNLFLIDLYLWIYTSAFAGTKEELKSPSGEITTGTYVFFKTFLKMLRNHQPDMICVASDCHAKTFRKQMYEKYKNNRPEAMPEGMSQQIKRTKEILNIMGIPVYEMPGYEADDIIGTVVDKIEKSDEDIKIIICTRDKDAIQLLREDKVEMLDINKGNKTIFSDIIKKWGVTPIQFVDFLALQGDPSDNVPGVKGIGPKTAVELLKEWGSLDRIFRNNEFENHIPIAATPKVCEKLINQKEMCLFSKNLVTIRRDVPIEINFEDMKVKEFDWNKLNSIFEELGFHSLMQARTKNRRLF